MTLRERILAVYRGETPDVVPFMLDLSHWFYHKNRLPWDLSAAYDKPERALVEYHRRVGAGFYLPNLAAIWTTQYAGDVVSEVQKEIRGGGPQITWRFRTPLGTIERVRRWEEQTYAWGIRKWGIQNEQDLRVFGYAMASRTFVPMWEKYQEWTDCVGDNGAVYLSVGYSAMGHLLHYWMGVERTMYAVSDWPAAMRDVVDRINENTLRIIELAAASPAEIILMGDNISSDIQSPRFFETWSAPFYRDAVRRLHAAGKCVAVHIDGRLRGAIRMIRDTGADCADAITPTPMGDLRPGACRDEAGPDFILSGGVSPDLWLPTAPINDFRRAVIEWLELRKRSMRLIANAGDQVPPGAEEDRILIMRDLVEKCGRY